MTDTDLRRVEAILAQFPGPVRLTPGDRRRRLVVLACVTAIGAILLFFLLRSDGVSENIIYGWAAIALIAIGVIHALVNLVPGVNYLTLDATGFEIKTPFRRFVAPWKAVRNFMARSQHGRRHIAFDLASADAPTAVDRVLRGAGRLTDNYGLPHNDLARLMNEWRARALRE